MQFMARDALDFVCRQLPLEALGRLARACRMDGAPIRAAQDEAMLPAAQLVLAARRLVAAGVVSGELLAGWVFHGEWQMRVAATGGDTDASVAREIARLARLAAQPRERVPMLESVPESVARSEAQQTYSYRDVCSQSTLPNTRGADEVLALRHAEVRYWCRLDCAVRRLLEHPTCPLHLSAAYTHVYTAATSRHFPHDSTTRVLYHIYAPMLIRLGLDRAARGAVNRALMYIDKWYVVREELVPISQL